MDAVYSFSRLNTNKRLQFVITDHAKRDSIVTWHLDVSISNKCVAHNMKQLESFLMPWSHLCIKPPRMSNVRQILEVPRKWNVLSRSATYYAALTRVSSLPPRRRHNILKFLSTFQKASHRPRNYHVLPRRCRICHELTTYHPKSLKLLYVAHTRQLYAMVWPVTTALKPMYSFSK